MYVVRRPFRHYDEVLLPGSVVESGSIKRFKNRLAERVIVEVTEQDFDKWNEYFIAKYGTPILVPKKVSEKPAAAPVKAAPVKATPAKATKTTQA